jgi:hypothetical protein
VPTPDGCVLAEVWRGNRFHTVVHYVFSGAWVYVTTTFAAALWNNLQGLE